MIAMRLAPALVLASLFFGPSALAAGSDPGPPAADHDEPEAAAIPSPRRSKSDLGMLSFEVLTQSWHTPPSLTLRGDDAPRRLVGLSSGTIAPVRLYGFDATMGVRIQGFTYRFLDFRLAWSGAPMGPGSAMANNTTVGTNLGTMSLFEFGESIGGQLVGDHFKVGFEFGGGVAYASATGDITDPLSGGGNGTFKQLGGYVRVTAAGCTRMGQGLVDEGSSWICLTAAPSIYELAPFNGVTFGLRVDL